MTGNLLVTPEKLMSTATEFSNNANEVRTTTNAMLDLVNGLNSSWTGEAASSFQRKFNELSDDMARIYAMINEHNVDLMEMARNYQSAEQTNASTANSLQGDVIS